MKVFVMKCKEYNLPVNVVDYIKNQLSWEKSLSKTILETTNITFGKKISLLPVDVNIDNIDNYSHGNVTSRSDSVNWMIEKIIKHLKADKNHIVLLQHSYASPKDRVVIESDLPIIKYLDDVFVYIDSGYLNNVDAIKKCLLFSDSHHFIGIMSSIDICYSELIDKFSSEILRKLVKNSKYLVVSAFDVEGYILCEI